MPRILFVNHVAVLGGGERSLLDIAAHFKETCSVALLDRGPLYGHLQARDIHVEVIPAPTSLTSVVRGGAIARDLRAIPATLKLAWKLSRMAREYDVIYANSQKAMIIAAMASVLAAKPLIWHLRDLMTDEHFSRSHQRVATIVANRFTVRVIANSEATRRAFVRNGGREDLVHTILNGIDETPFTTPVPADEMERLRHDLGLNGSPVIGAFSRIARWKGQHVLVDVLARLPDAHVLLVGDALFEEDAAYMRELKLQVARLGVGDRVHFLGFRDDVPRLLQLVDVVAHTSTSPEPFGRVIVEGMLSGKPVVAADSGGVLEIVDEGETGILVPPGDSVALAAALDDLLKQPEMRRRLSERGRETALRRFTVSSMLRKIEATVGVAAREAGRWDLLRRRKKDLASSASKDRSLVG